MPLITSLVKALRRALSLATARITSFLIRPWRHDRFNYSPEEWRQMRISFSDNGEDLVVINLLKRIAFSQQGIYVDAGAFDPVLISNTMLLYKSGWRGVNIDANPATIEKFKQIRPDDINICSPLSNREETFQYLEYPIAGNNRLTLLDASDEKSMIGEEPLKRTIVHSRTLSQILEEAYPSIPAIDFLSVDCEGYDLDVLRGLDFSRYCPRIICIEHAGRLCADGEASSQFLSGKGYQICAKLGQNLIFTNQSHLIG